MLIIIIYYLLIWGFLKMAQKLANMLFYLSFIPSQDKRDLSRNNWAHVIYDAVITKMSEKDSEILTSVIEILEKVLAVLDKNPAECSSEVKFVFT